jgi:tripartite-type tricarboxylate transporter receptor subunit TctC
MNLSLRTALRGLAAAAGIAISFHTFALADTWPSKPIRLIVTFVPGGGADIIGRYVAKHLGDALGQPVVVDNKPGAGGLIGVQAGLAAPADGYTFVLISSSYTVNPSLYKLKFDPVNDITPVVQVSKGPLLVVVNPKLPATNLKELVALGKAKPDTLNYASSGQGSLLHLAAAQFADEAGFDMRHVPYKGGGAALTDLVAGQVDVYFAATASALPHVKAGKLRPLAVTTEERIPALPNVPTIAESGLKGYEATLWYGIIAPKGLPPEILRRMNVEVNKVLALKETPAKLEVDGAVPGGGSPADFQAVIAREIPKWGKVVRKIGIQPE